MSKQYQDTIALEVTQARRLAAKFIIGFALFGMVSMAGAGML